MSNRRTISFAVAFILMSIVVLTLSVQNADAQSLALSQNSLKIEATELTGKTTDAPVFTQEDSTQGATAPKDTPYETGGSTPALARTSDMPLGLGLYIFAAVVVSAVILIITAVERNDAKNSARRKEFLE